jgi:hypothetical protein
METQMLIVQKERDIAIAASITTLKNACAAEIDA